jgi:membrane-associated phospholipid phosphatase
MKRKKSILSKIKLPKIKLPKFKLPKIKLKDIPIRLPSMIFSSPVVTTLTTVLLLRRIEYLGLILSSIFFYIIFPFLTYLYLYKKGLITDERFDFNIRKREERPLYNLIMIMGFFTNYVLLSMYNIPIVQEVALFLLLSFFVFTLVTFFWKISGHMTQTVLLILILAYIFKDYQIYIILVGYLVCIPLVGLSRIKLKHHDIWQVLAGTFVTTAIGILVFTIA